MKPKCISASHYLREMSAQLCHRGELNTQTATYERNHFCVEFDLEPMKLKSE